MDRLSTNFKDIPRILVEELCEMGVKANIALHVDVTGPGNHDCYYVLGGSMFLL